MDSLSSMSREVIRSREKLDLCGMAPASNAATRASSTDDMIRPKLTLRNPEGQHRMSRAG
jgi:hypothetical protein